MSWIYLSYFLIVYSLDICQGSFLSNTHRRSYSLYENSMSSMIIELLRLISNFCRNNLDKIVDKIRFLVEKRQHLQFIVTFPSLKDVELCALLPPVTTTTTSSNLMLVLHCRVWSVTPAAGAALQSGFQ